MGDQEQKPITSVKYDWYQTEANVVITILVKNVLKDEARITFREQSVSVHLTLPDESQHIREMILAYEINPSQCCYVVTPSKIEVKLMKVEAVRWTQLEGTVKVLKEIPTAGPTSSGPPSYPTSKPGKNWTVIEREMKEQEANEKPVGEEALNKLFQDIYGKGSDSVRRAMNKSYMESGGTVLSTNWDEISKQRVDVKPPDGMEYKKWDS